MIQLTLDALRKMFPRAPQPILDAFVAKQAVLDRVGVNHTRNRLAFSLAQVEHESSGFTRLRENINYSPERAAQIWQSRFQSADDCLAKVKSWRGDPEFKVKLIDAVYGARMGNRPGTHDGSLYISFHGEDEREGTNREHNDLCDGSDIEGPIHYKFAHRDGPSALLCAILHRSLTCALVQLGSGIRPSTGSGA